MDIVIAIFIVTIAVINAIARYMKDKEKRAQASAAHKPRRETGQAGRTGGIRERQHASLQEFLKKLQDIQIEVTPPRQEDEVPVHAHVAEYLEEPAPDFQKPVLRQKLVESNRAQEEALTQPIRPLGAPLIQTPALETKPLKPAVAISHGSVKRGVILAELLGPPLARRKMGVKSRRLF
jgi:hypothetical protein